MLAFLRKRKTLLSVFALIKQRQNTFFFFVFDIVNGIIISVIMTHPLKFYPFSPVQLIIDTNADVLIELFLTFSKLFTFYFIPNTML